MALRRRYVFYMGHDKMWSGADLRGASPLVSFNHVIDPHFVAFSSSLYTTTCNPEPNPNLNLNSNPNPNPKPTVITDPQVGRKDPQIITVQIHPAPHFVVCRFIWTSVWDADSSVALGYWSR